MKMNALKELYISMHTIDSEMQQFQVTLGAISFDCLFSIRDKPHFMLSLTSRGLNPKFFLLPVKKGFWIEPYFHDFYGDLVSLLNTGSNTGNKLIPKEFLANLNREIPIKAKSRMNPKPSDVVKLRRDITEQRDKPFFDTWVYWSQRGPKEKNRLKTKLALGIEALEYSIKMKASSKWSTKDLGREWKGQRKR